MKPEFIGTKRRMTAISENGMTDLVINQPDMTFSRPFQPEHAAYDYVIRDGAMNPVFGMKRIGTTSKFPDENCMPVSAETRMTTEKGVGYTDIVLNRSEMKITKPKSGFDYVIRQKDNLPVFGINNLEE